MHKFILLVAWITLGGCWPTAKREYELGLKTARDSQPIMTPTNSSDLPTQTIALSKKINTPLGSLIFLLTLATYWLLMRHTTSLSNEIILPQKSLEGSMSAMLWETWPKSYSDALFTYFGQAWVLFAWEKPIKGKSSQDDNNPILEALGYSETKTTSPYIPDPYYNALMVPVKTFSPVMKSLIHIGIRNFFSFWLVLGMIISTLAYNGVPSRNVTNDSIIRLVLVCVYALANCGHQYYTATLLYRNFTYVLFQTC